VHGAAELLISHQETTSNILQTVNKILHSVGQCSYWQFIHFIHCADCHKDRQYCIITSFLGDIAVKQFHVLQSMLPLCGLSVCHVRAL